MNRFQFYIFVYSHISLHYGPEGVMWALGTAMSALLDAVVTAALSSDAERIVPAIAKPGPAYAK
jgi:hypothetical protein